MCPIRQGALKKKKAHVGGWVLFFEIFCDFFDKYVFGVFELSMQRNVQKPGKKYGKNGTNDMGIFLLFFVKHFRHGLFFNFFWVFLNSTCRE
jgi:hypothetical protein